MEFISSKKRKLCSELEYEDHGGGEFPESSVPPADSGASSSTKYDEEHSNGVVKTNLRSPDLENVDDLKSKGSETEISSASINGGFSSEATPTTELSGDPNQGLMDSSPTSKKKSPPAPLRETPLEKTPTAAELEEFFATAENSEQKRFAEKYNYDIVKDVPLKGKYQWITGYHKHQTMQYTASKGTKRHTTSSVRESKRKE